MAEEEVVEAVAASTEPVPKTESQPAPDEAVKAESGEPSKPADEPKAASEDKPAVADGVKSDEAKPAEDSKPAEEAKPTEAPAAAAAEAPAAASADAKPAEDGDAEGAAAAPQAKQLEAGDMLPDLPPLESDESTDAATKTISVSDLVKDSGIILFLYCRANTPGCTNQAVGLRDNLAGIKAAGYQVVGISADKPKSQATWKVKSNLPFHLLCDTSMQAIKALGAAKGEKGIARSHFVVEKGGKILQAMYNIKPKDSVNAAVQQVTGKPAVQPAKASRKPTVIEEIIDEDEPPRSKLDEPPLSSKRRSKPSSKKIEAEADAVEVGAIEVDEDVVTDDDDEMPRKKGRSRR